MINVVICRSLDFMPPPSKKLCVGPNAQFISELDSQSSSMPSGIQSRLSQDILLDHAKILFLFQCFREAQNNQLCKALHKNFREGCINLENQVLYPHHVVSLGLFLSQSRHKWKTLNLAKCCLLDEDLYDLHHYLCVETNRSTVEEFNISGNDLTEESSSILTEVISQLQPTCLKLSDNWIRFAGLKHLCSEMTEISTIKTLCVEMIGMKLNGITITTPDKEVISNMMSSLSELYMGRNGLYDEGAELLSEGLVKTSSLTVLSVWNCNIFTKGAVALANALSKNTSLETLDLRSNDIGDDGAVAFANVLSNDNETLTFLNVQENTFSPKGIKALQEVATAQNKYYFACSWTEMVHANIKYM